MDGSRPLALTLSIRNADALANGSPLTLVVDGRNATIGRSPTVDWPLPDPERHISSRHCEVAFRDGGYELVDISTNGTFLNDEPQRLGGPHRLGSGDVIRIGDYEIVAALAPSQAAAPPPPPSPPPPPPPPPAQPPPPAPPEPEPAQASAPAPVAEPAADDLWGKMAASNAVDWSRGGFGAPAPLPRRFDPASPTEEPLATSDAVPEPAQAAVLDEAAPAGRQPGGAGLDDLLHGAELPRDKIRQDDAAALVQAGMLLQRLIAGMVVMLEARARAKSQLGAQGTGLEIAGNNPLKFARSPEQALQYMLNPQERGFMSAERAIEDSFRDLQAHQLATLRAMQGALRATLERFSPKAIRARAETKGVLERILPAARDAALWKAYEKEFSGVAFNSDEAFMDMFSKQFRQAYDEISRQG